MRQTVVNAEADAGIGNIHILTYLLCTRVMI